MPTQVRKYFTVPDKSFVLYEPSDVVVTLLDDSEVTYRADRWQHFDGQTLEIFLGDELLATYPVGTWKGCGSFNSGLVYKEGQE